MVLSIMGAKFLLHLSPLLRAEIKRQARKENVSMNDYIITVMEQFIAIQKDKHNGKDTERTGY